jgi:transposase InsO family protein
MMAAEDHSILIACRVPQVSESGFYAQRRRPPSARAIRHAALTDLIGRIHLDSRGTYGARRVHAELTLGHGLSLGHGTVELLMRRAGIAGVSGRPRFRRIPNVATASDLVERRFLARQARPPLGHRHRAPRGALNRAVMERAPPPARRSGSVKLGAARTRGCG